MIHFPALRTRRVCVELSELTLDQAITMCKLPEGRHETAISQFLRFSAAQATAPKDGYITDPRLWTVSERLRLVVQYMMGVADDAPNFSVGNAKLLDYIDFTAEAESLVLDGITVGETDMQMRPLLGLQAEALEILCADRGEWLIGCIAAQIVPVGSLPNWAEMPDVAVLAWHKERIKEIRNLPESSYERLLHTFMERQGELRQFFNLGVSDDGIVCMPNNPGDEVPPGRFRSSSCLSQSTRSLFARPHRG